jgi:hypothetical protein
LAQPREIWQYDDKTKNEIIALINTFDADFGGTEIL